MIFLYSIVVHSQQVLCYGSSAHYSVDTNENGGKGSTNSVYNWSVNQVSFEGNIQMVFKDRTNDIIVNWGSTPPGEYELIVNETTNDCLGLSQSLKIKLLPLPESHLSNKFICVNSITKEVITTVLLDTQLSETLYSFKWMLNGENLPTTSNNLVVSQLGDYSVNIVNLSTGCSNKDNAVVALSSTSVSRIQINNIFEENQRIVITVLNGLGNYEYSIDGFNFQDSPSFDVSKAGNYPIIVRDKNGCSDEMLPVNIMRFNKFFTPNNDGYNDIWKIEGLLKSMKPVITIYDRYGVLLKTLLFDDIGWDGTLNGAVLPADDYWFAIDYLNSDGIFVRYKSHFSLLR